MGLSIGNADGAAGESMMTKMGYKIGYTVTLAMACIQLTATWNLWKNKQLSADAALEEIGRILQACDASLTRSLKAEDEMGKGEC